MAVSAHVWGAAQYRFDGTTAAALTVTLSVSAAADLATLTWSAFDATTANREPALATLATLTWTAYDVTASGQVLMSGTVQVGSTLVEDVEILTLGTGTVQIASLLTATTEDA